MFVACHVKITSFPFIEDRKEYCVSFAADASSTVSPLFWNSNSLQREKTVL